jgi:hypothetical protein
MEEQITKKIVNNFIKQNNSIKENIGNKIIPEFLNYNKYLRIDDYKNYIMKYLKKIFLEFLKLNKEENNDFSLENNNELKNFKNVISNIDQYNKYYEGKTKIFIDSILNDKTIEYLDFQVGIEKKEKKSIKIVNKNTKDNFEGIIQTFLNNNFYFIAQKHYVHCIKKDISESFTNDIGEGIIKKVEVLLKDESEDLFKRIYKKKFEDFKDWINKNYRKNNNNIYNSLINTSVDQGNTNRSNNKKGGINSSINKISERSGKTSNKNIPKIKTAGINPSSNTLTGNLNDKKSENNTSLSNKSKNQENISQNRISIIGTPEENIKDSINYVKNIGNTINPAIKSDENDSDNLSDREIAPPPNV